MPPKASAPAPIVAPNRRSAVDSGASKDSTASTSKAAGPAAPPSGPTNTKVAAPAAGTGVNVAASRSKSSIVVNSRQTGNPIIPHIKGVAWEYGDIVPDYVVGQHTCVLYLSLRYHRLHPEYLFNRIEKLGGMYSLRILLVMCDVNDHQDPVREISKICIINNITVMVTWTPEEAGQYLATYKLFEHKSPEMLKERINDDYRSYLNRALTNVKGVNKTDVLTLSTSFGSVDRMVHASPEELANCPGLGDVKVRRLLEAFTGKFKPGAASSSSALEAAKSKVARGRKGKERADREMTAEGEGSRAFSPDWPDEEEKEEEGAGAVQSEEGYNSPDWPDDEDDSADGDRTRAGSVASEVPEPVRRPRNPFVIVPE